MRSVRVEWEGPFSIDQVLELDDEDEDCGLYQIYGRHIIFGGGSLLYIGMTISTFSQRFTEHIVWLEEEEGVFIHIGRIVSEDYAYDPPYWSDWQKVLEDTEALTIYWHSPPYNSQHIQRYKRQPLKVVNLGKRGSLDKEYSSSNRRRWGWTDDDYS